MTFCWRKIKLTRQAYVRQQIIIQHKNIVGNATGGLHRGNRQVQRMLELWGSSGLCTSRLVRHVYHLKLIEIDQTGKLGKNQSCVFN